MVRRFLPSILLISAFACQVARAQLVQDAYINRGVSTNPVVSARTFINEGVLIYQPTPNSLQVVPWEPQGTLNYTNRGTMDGSVGFQFETVDPFDPLHGLFGFRRPAQNFVNDAGSSITSHDGGGIFTFGVDASGGAGAISFVQANASVLKINSQNITNRGDLTVGPNGVMQLFGNEADLRSGTLIVDDTGSMDNVGFGGNFVDITGTNFYPATGVYDLGYGIDINTNMSPGGIIQGVNIQTPTFRITNELSTVSFLSFCETSLGLTNPLVTMRDERINATNRVIQVVAISVSDPDISAFASFLPQVVPIGTPQGGYLSPLVELRYAITNLRTLQPEDRALYVFDQLGSQTNYILSQNIVDGTLRPAPFVVFRDFPGLGEIGDPGIPVPADVFVNPGTGVGSYSNNIVTNQYAIYSAEIQSIATRLPVLSDVGITNASGRVEITATNLQMGNTRIRGEGLVSINSENLTGGENSILDTPHVSFNLSSSGPVLDLKEMTPDQVGRLNGYIQAYSATFTNVYDDVSGTGTNAVTNTVETRFELFAVKADTLRSREAVLAHELRLRSTNNANGSVVYHENLIVTNLVEISAPHVTLDEGSRLFMAKGVQVSYTNFSGISTFTNLGVFQANELAELQKSQTEGMDSFVNRGEIIAFGTIITSQYFENSGDIISSNDYSTIFGGPGFIQTGDCFGQVTVDSFAGMTVGDIVINAAQGKIDGGQFATLGDLRFSGNAFKFDNHRAAIGGRMTFDVSDLLADSGRVGANRWSMTNGFEMTAVRPIGDLLGTEFRSYAAPLALVDHVWSAEDRGATVAGFTDNAAIGRLHIEGATNSTFQFIPTQGGSAIYIDVLDIAGVQAASLRDFTNRVKLRMNVYYGDVESTNSNLTAERLNRILGTNSPYNFYWVSNWAGPYSGIDVPLTSGGPVQRFNRALRQSPNVDSDGDGIPNLYDPFPFPPNDFGITGITASADTTTVQFGFMTQSAGKYSVEYSTNLASPAWQPLKEVLQNNPAGGIMSVTDQIQAGSPQRYYRVRKAP
jgi:hypothetical protein